MSPPGWGAPQPSPFRGAGTRRVPLKMPGVLIDKRPTMLSSAQETLLLVEDHPLFVRALEDLIGHHYPFLEVAAVPSCAAARAWLAEHSSQCQLRAVFCDLNLPDAQGLAVVEQLRPLTPAPLVIVSAESQESFAVAAQALGVLHFVSKRLEPAQLLQALEPVLGSPAMDAGAARVSALQTLSASQQRVAEQLVRGLANKEIARELQIAPETVKSHVRDIMQRLGARNRTEVVLQLVRPAR